MKNNSLEILKKTKNDLNSPEDMKMKIREYIDKLNDSSTRDLYFKNFKTLLQTYTDDNSVSIIFPLLLSYTNDAMTLIGKEYQIILVAFALNVNYIKNITYTILTKIMKAISINLEKYNNFEIQKACSVVIIEIFDQIIKMGENQENAFTFIIKYFFELIEKNKAIVSQPKDNGVLNGSFVIISDLLCYIINLNSNKGIEENDPNIKNQAIEQINRKIERDEIEKASTLNSLQKILEETLLNLISKFIQFKYPNAFLVESITYLVDIITYEDYKLKIKELIPYTNKILYNTEAKLYLCKTMICHLYSHLFKKMNFEQEDKIISEMVQALNFTTKDRVVKVQIAAEEALLIYNNINKTQNIDTEVQTKRKMSKLNLLRNLSKINKEKNNIMSSKKVRKEIYEIGIGKFLRSNDYLNNRDEENLLMLKKEINKSRSKSKSLDKKGRNISKKRIKLKKNNDNKNDGGIMIFQRFNGVSEELINGDNIDNINNKIKSAKYNTFMKNIKDEDINLNDDIESIKKSISKKEKTRIENENRDNDENNINEKNKDNLIKENENINQINNNISDNKSNKINIGSKENKIININEKEKNNNEKNSNEKDIKNESNDIKNIKEKEDNKDKNLFNFKEEENNIGDQATPNYKENISEKKIKNRSKKNQRLSSKESSEKFGNSNNELNISDNNDSSNIQGNTVEDINRLNTLSNRHMKNKTKDLNNINNKYTNDIFNQLNKTFNKELDKMINDFNDTTNTKLNKINNRLLGLSQNINRIKTNLNLIKHTNNLNFKDSNVIINEEKEEQSVESSMTKNDNKYNSKSYNILWETITLYLKNENYEEAYIKALQGGDDLIFLRLIFSIGTNCLQYISINTNKLILKHFNSIFRTFSMQNQFLEYIKTFYNMKMLNIKYFSVEELNDFMQTLFEIKALKNDTGKNAQFLYDNILKDFSSQNNK